jgi:GAF domain-containing protein
MTRESVLLRTFVEMADTLVDDFDVVDLLTRLTDRCVDVLDISAAGIMLASPRGGDLRVVASSSESMRLVELFELQEAEGPCFDSFHSGALVTNPNLMTDDARWPRFARLAVDAGFRAVLALPMKLRGHTVGVLNLFGAVPGALDAADAQAAQALADVATIAVLQQRAAADSQALNEQLTQALQSRVAIEQAKGMIAERTGLDMEQSFKLLRDHARSHNLRLVDVAHAVQHGTVDLAPPR